MIDRTTFLNLEDEMKTLVQTVNLSQLSDGYAGRVIDDALREACKDL